MYPTRRAIARAAKLFSWKARRAAGGGVVLHAVVSQGEPDTQNGESSMTIAVFTEDISGVGVDASWLYDPGSDETPDVVRIIDAHTVHFVSHGDVLLQTGGDYEWVLPDIDAITILPGSGVVG